MPDEPVTREDMALMLYRYAEKVAKSNLPAVNAAIEFTDAKDISIKSFDAVSVMQRAGIINGIEENNSISFAPKNQANRAQASAMIARFYTLLDK